MLCGPPCGQSGQDLDPSVPALGGGSDQVGVDNGRLVVVEALALAWVLLLGHVGGGSLVQGLHMVEDHSLEVAVAPVWEQFLQELVVHSSPQ